MVQSVLLVYLYKSLHTREHKNFIAVAMLKVFEVTAKTMIDQKIRVVI